MAFIGQRLKLTIEIKDNNVMHRSRIQEKYFYYLGTEGRIKEIRIYVDVVYYILYTRKL